MIILFMTEHVSHLSSVSVSRQARHFLKRRLNMDNFQRENGVIIQLNINKKGQNQTDPVSLNRNSLETPVTHPRVLRECHPPMEGQRSRCCANTSLTGKM